MKDWMLVALVVVAFVLFVAMMVVGTNKENKERERLIQQCIDDGRKEYECRAMFHVETRTQVIPVVIPTR